MKAFHWLTLALGISVIGGIWVWNTWQQWRLRRRIVDSFRLMGQGAHSSGKAAPAGESRLAPHWALPHGREDNPQRSVAPHDEPVIWNLHMQGEAGVRAPGSPGDPLAWLLPKPAPEIDEKIDYIAKVVPGRLVEAADVPKILSVRRVLVEGHIEGNLWRPLAAGGIYHGFRFSLQLVDRQSACSLEQLVEFAEQVRDFALEQGGETDFPAVEHALERARQLDAFCTQVDQQINLNLVASLRPFPVARVRARALADGLHCAEGGYGYVYALRGLEGYRLCDGQQRPLDELEETLGLAFSLNVPHVVEGHTAFRHMCELAQQLALELEGELVDDRLQALRLTDLEQIEQQLDALQTLMHEQGIPPGSPLAQRLFS